MRWFWVSCLCHFGTDKDPSKNVTLHQSVSWDFTVIISMASSDVLQLAARQTVGGVSEESLCFMWKAGKHLQASVNNSAVWSDALSADYALVSVGSKQENEFHSTTQSLCIFKMVWLESSQPHWKFGHFSHQQPNTDGSFDYWLDPAIKPLRDRHPANKDIDWLLGQFRHQGAERAPYKRRMD